MDGIGIGSPGGRGYRAPYGANNPNRYAACRGAEENLYRHSKLATYSILPAESLDQLDDSVPPANLGGGGKLRHFKWGPVGNALVYVDLNKNIRYRFSV